MNKWGFMLRFSSRLAVVALISSLFVSLPVGQASATEYPPCTIQGTSADESLTGTDGNDVICTGGGNDVVSAGAGDDIVIAENGGSVEVDLGTGNDFLTAPTARMRLSMVATVTTNLLERLGLMNSLEMRETIPWLAAKAATA